jgi:hypothetical protein
MVVELGTSLHQFSDMHYNRPFFLARIWQNLPADLRSPDILALLFLGLVVLGSMFAWPYFGWGQ